MYPVLPKNNHFIAWIDFQRRAASMQPFFEYNLVFVPTKFNQRRLKLIDYLYKSFKSLGYLLARKPTVLWVQLPPTPLLNLALLYKSLNKNVIVIADCHNGLFWGKWKAYLKGAKDLNKVDIIITHNRVIRDLAIEQGADPKKMMVLETKPAQKAPAIRSAFNLDLKGPWILMPCAFAEDEPLTVVFEAAKLIPDITVVISGDVRRGGGFHDLSKLPSNVKLAGYLSKEDYEALFSKTDAVLGLTTEPHVQLSVANEATGFEIPMVLSDTPLLRELFSRGAVYVNTFDPVSMAEGIRHAVQNKEDLRQEVKQLKIERNAKWQGQAESLKQRISTLIRSKSK